MMNIHEDLIFWNQATVAIGDIRLIRIPANADPSYYRLPADCFLYMLKGRARVFLNDRLYRLNGNSLLHGVKGMSLLVETEEALEMILLFYKAVLPAHDKTSSQPTHATSAPDRVPFSFSPLYPAELRETLERMFRAWNGATQMEKLQAKSLFYHFVYQLHWQMQRDQLLGKKPSLLDQALAYMHDHFNQPITVESIADTLHCSTRYLNRLFTETLGESPVRVLTKIRMDKVAHLLASTDMTLQQIAENTSYSDARVLSRIFKKQFSMTPTQFREEQMHPLVPKWSPRNADHVIGDDSPRCYTENGYQHNSMYRRKGEFSMFTRSKPSIAAIMFLCFAVLLGGCANTNGNEAATSPAPSPAPTAEAEKPTVRSFTDAFGTRDIPANPQKIYSIGATSALLALGIQPVGAPQYEVGPDYYLSNYSTPVNIVGDYPPNYEALLELQPDLIVASGYIDQEVYEQLTKIAPTATFEWMGTDIYDQFTQVAEIVGKQEEAAEWIKEHQERAVAAKAQIADSVSADETVSILWIMEDTYHVVGNRNLGHVLYNLLGLKPSALIQKQIDGNNGDLVYTDPLSLETLPDYDADRIIVMISDVQAGAADNFKAMQKTSLWKNLKAVKNNQVYEVPYDKWWSYTIFSADALLADAVKLFDK